MLAHIGPMRLRLQVMSAQTGAIGPGKAAVLEAIRDHGSISAAGRALGISYKRCWALADEMNRCWQEPVITTARGGAAQGAALTETGEAVLEAYRALEQSLLSVTRDSPAYAVLTARLRDSPLPD